jgi:quercetin dioxygenase-like cupin family protein
MVAGMVTDLEELGEALLAEAADATNGTASRAVVHGDRQRAVLMAIRAGHALGEHNAPPAATVQVLRGQATLHAGGEATPLRAGQLAEIPLQRHDLAADQDTVALLTVAIDPPEARGAGASGSP